MRDLRITENEDLYFIHEGGRIHLCRKHPRLATDNPLNTGEVRVNLLCEYFLELEFARKKLSETT